MHDEEMLDDEPFDEDYISKSQRKREAHALTDLGKRIAALSAKDLASLPLGDDLRRALDEARSIRSHIARKRQQQYIGKLLRKVDTEELEAAFARIEQRGQLEAARFHRVERWRDRLLAEGDAALGELLAEHPGADRGHLRRLLREARREAETDKPPKSARALFKALRELIVE